MVNALKNPYGLREGEIVHASDIDVGRGLACNCVCPACGHRLQAHQGTLRQHYFSHYKGSDCGFGYQTALHLMAKEILATEKKLLLPPLTVRTERSLLRPGTFGVSEELVPSGVQLNFDSVVLEKALGGIVPDVVLQAQGRKLLVEIRVTHAVDDTKLAKIKGLGLSAIEFDFSKTDRAINRKALKKILTCTYDDWLGPRKWLYHRDESATQEQVNQKYLDVALPVCTPAVPLVLPPATLVSSLPAKPKKPTQLSLFQR